jgi:hypothetical protein
MPHTQAAAAGRPLPRGHLLALNRSFRRTLKPRTRPPHLEAHTDAVRFLALYCQAHGKPLLASQLQHKHIQSSSPTSSPAGSPPPPTTATVACTPSSSGRWPRATSVPAHGRHEATAPSRTARRRRPRRAPGSAPQDLRGPGLHQPARHRHHPAAGRYRHAPRRVRRHDPRRRRPGPADGVGARQGRPPQALRSAARGPRRWTATCGPGRTIGSLTCPTCGSAATAP